MARTHASSSRADDPIRRLHAAVFSSVKAFIGVGMVSIGGCMPPVMQPWASLEYGVGRGPTQARAEALLPFGGDISEGVMVDVKVWLAHADPFTIVFPDGFRVSSRDVTAEVLRNHGGSLGAPSRINDKLAEFHQLQWKSLEGVTAIFEFANDEVTVLRFCSPTRLPDSGGNALSFIAADGTPVTLPLTYTGMSRLFGQHVITRSDFLIAAFFC